jgi:hypothetical protein
MNEQMPPAVTGPVEPTVRPLACDGGCDEHVGEHRYVRVTDPKSGHDWGNFCYCEEAVRIDEFRGLRVEAA